MSANSNTVMAIFTTVNPPLDLPQGVAVDLQGVVYVVDTRNNRVVAMPGIQQTEGLVVAVPHSPVVRITLLSSLPL